MSGFFRVCVSKSLTLVNRKPLKLFKVLFPVEPSSAVLVGGKVGTLPPGQSVKPHQIKEEQNWYQGDFPGYSYSKIVTLTQ